MEEKGNGEVDKDLRGFTAVGFYSVSRTVSRFYCFFFMLNDISEAVVLRHHFLTCSHLCCVSNTINEMYLTFAGGSLCSIVKIPKWTVRRLYIMVWWARSENWTQSSCHGVATPSPEVVKHNYTSSLDYKWWRRCTGRFGNLGWEMEHAERELCGRPWLPSPVSLHFAFGRQCCLTLRPNTIDKNTGSILPLWDNTSQAPAKN